jgi:hypothetical protein
MAGHGRATSTEHAGGTGGAPLPVVRLVAGLVKAMAIQHAMHWHQRRPGSGSGLQAGHHGRPQQSHQLGVCGLHLRCPGAAGAVGRWPSQGSGDPACRAPAPAQAGQQLRAVGGPLWQDISGPPARGVRSAPAVPRCRWCGWSLAWSRQWRSSTAGTGTREGRALARGCGLHKPGTAKRPGRCGVPGEGPVRAVFRHSAKACRQGGKAGGQWLARVGKLGAV